MATYTFKITIDPSWTADGFKLTNGKILDAVERTLLPYALPGEVKVSRVRQFKPKAKLHLPPGKTY